MGAIRSPTVPQYTWRQSSKHGGLLPMCLPSTCPLSYCGHWNRLVYSIMSSNNDIEKKDNPYLVWRRSRSLACRLCKIYNKDWVLCDQNKAGRKTYDCAQHNWLLPSSTALFKSFSRWNHGDFLNSSIIRSSEELNVQLATFDCKQIQCITSNKC